MDEQGVFVDDTPMHSQEGWIVQAAMIKGSRRSNASPDQTGRGEDSDSWTGELICDYEEACEDDVCEACENLLTWLVLIT